MHILGRITKNAIFYTTSTLLQKGISFLLLPVYTRYLTPNDYGILAIVTSINAFLVILTTFSLNASMNRFYFEYRDDETKLKEFWGTIITFILLISIIVSLLMLIFGKYLLTSFIGNVPFSPFVVLGILTVMFQPVFTIYLSVLQTTEKAKKYTVYSLCEFILNITIATCLIIFAGWGASGVLTGALSTSVVFFFISLYSLRNDIKLGLNLKYLSSALKYSGPLIPHQLSGQITTYIDKFLINFIIGTALTGIYNIGYMLGNIVSITAIGINRAYIPISMRIRQVNNEEELRTLKEISSLLVVFYCLLASFISIYSREIVFLFTTKIFHKSHIVVPYIAFAFVLNGIYFIFVNILFYIKNMTKWVTVGTVCSAISNVILNLILIPKYGIVGAAIATMISQAVLVLIIRMLAKKHDPILWDHWKYFTLFAISFLVSLIAVNIGTENILIGLLIKSGLFTALFVCINYAIFKHPFYILLNGMKVFEDRKTDGDK